MATKRKKRASKRRAKPQSIDADRLSPATYTLRRDAKIANLYFVHRLTLPPAIYDELLSFCRECGERKQRHYEKIWDKPIIGCSSFAPLITENRASGLRMVETVVKRIRENAEPEEVLKLRRPIETEKVRRTWEHLLQVELDVIADNSLEKRQKMSASGEIKAIYEPRYSAQDKDRAKKNAKDLTEKLGKLEGAIMLAVDEPIDRDGPEIGKKKQFAFTFPNVTGTPKDLDAMIAMNLESGKVN
jgi:hypothetical protein